MTPLQQLQQQNSQFPRQVMQVADNIYTATGFAAANVSMIIGDGGLIIVDTSESTRAAELILAEFRKITDLPVQAIIYTHGHRDHISGASVFAAGGQPEIFARANFVNDLREGSGRPAPMAALMARTKRQFGMGLAFPGERINIGVGPGDRPMEGMGAGYMEPTYFIEGEQQQISACGVTLEIVAAPGETPDQAAVWYKDKAALFCADNFYHSFPNLYAIRGTRYRDFDDWADTLDRLLQFDADLMLTGHTLPVTGAANIRERLSDYRDAIRHVVSQTIAMINDGMTPGEIAATISLPDNLAEKPWLQEYYGKVTYAARAYFAGALGWFDGNPTNLQPLPPKQHAENLARLAGGVTRLREAMEAARADGQLQWALELCDALIRLGEDASIARMSKAGILRQLADGEINAPTRNYYLVSAQELVAQSS